MMKLFDRSFKVTRIGVEKNPFAEKWPLWLRGAQIALAGYREQGWSAVDQRGGLNRGKVVATGKWGDKLVLRRDGSWTSYPDRSAERLAAINEDLAPLNIPPFDSLEAVHEYLNTPRNHLKDQPHES